MAYIASHRFARISPTKARLVSDMVRGMPVDEALTARTSASAPGTCWSSTPIANANRKPTSPVWSWQGPGSTKDRRSSDSSRRTAAGPIRSANEPTTCTWRSAPGPDPRRQNRVPNVSTTPSRDHRQRAHHGTEDPPIGFESNHRDPQVAVVRAGALRRTPRRGLPHPEVRGQALNGPRLRRSRTSSSRGPARADRDHPTARPGQVVGQKGMRSDLTRDLKASPAGRSSSRSSRSRTPRSTPR